MARLARHCLDCGTLTTHGGRCQPCDNANHEAAYGGNWRTLSKQQRQQVPHCQCTGEGCKIHNGPCTATTDLTADHITPHGQGGTPATGLATLCRPCNAAKRDR